MLNYQRVNLKCRSIFDISEIFRLVQTMSYRRKSKCQPPLETQTRRPTRRHAAETMQWVRAQLDQCAGLWDGFVMGIPPNLWPLIRTMIIYIYIYKYMYIYIYTWYMMINHRIFLGNPILRQTQMYRILIAAKVISKGTGTWFVAGCFRWIPDSAKRLQMNVAGLYCK
jgi:hypothetical protein